MAAQVVMPIGRRGALGVAVNYGDLEAAIGARRLKRLLGILTVVETPQPGRPRHYARAKRTAYKMAKNAEDGSLELWLPAVFALGICPSMLGRIDGAPPEPRAVDPESLVPTQPFFPYQLAAVDFLCDPPALPAGDADGEGRSAQGALSGAPGAAGVAYMEMGTGMGKSRLGMAVAARGAGPTFVVVPTEAIRGQWIDEVCEVFPRLRVAPYVNPPRGSRVVPASPDTHDFVVGIVNTVRKKAPGFFDGYATVILDEAHELCSKANIEALWVAQGAPRVLGLSATPEGRPDGFDKIVTRFLGKPIKADRDVPGFDIADVNFTGRVREVEYAGDPEFCQVVVTEAGTVSAIQTVGLMVQDPARLRLVAAEVRRLVDMHESEQAAELGLGPRPESAATEKLPPGEMRRHCVFVFAEHRDYLPALRDVLAAEFGADVEVPQLEDDAAGAAADANDDADVNDAAGAILRGGATREEVLAAHQARVVLTTYGYSRRGVSIVNMTSIVLASPRRHGMHQILGRVTRRGSDESIVRQIVDIKDIRTPLKSQSTTRRLVYKEKKYPIFQVRFSHEDYAEDAPAPADSEEKVVWVPDA